MIHMLQGIIILVIVKSLKKLCVQCVFSVWNLGRFFTSMHSCIVITTKVSKESLHFSHLDVLSLVLRKIHRCWDHFGLPLRISEAEWKETYRYEYWVLMHAWFIILVVFTITTMYNVTTNPSRTYFVRFCPMNLRKKIHFTLYTLYSQLLIYFQKSAAK